MTDYYRVPQSIKGYYRYYIVLHYYRLLQSITECYRVLQNVRVSQSVYKVLQGITKYCKDKDDSSASTWTNFLGLFNQIQNKNDISFDKTP